MEGIKHVVGCQTLNHAHELFYARSDSFTIKDSHQVVDERFLIRQSNALIHALSLELFKHLLLVLLDFEFPLEEFRISLEVDVFILH